MEVKPNTSPSRPELDKLIEQAKEIVNSMTPEQKATMLKQQSEGWAKAEAQWARDYRDGKCVRD